MISFLVSVLFVTVQYKTDYTWKNIKYLLDWSRNKKLTSFLTGMKVVIIKNKKLGSTCKSKTEPHSGADGPLALYIYVHFSSGASKALSDSQRFCDPRSN